MASHLAAIFGTEQDRYVLISSACFQSCRLLTCLVLIGCRVNCSFYYKVSPLPTHLSHPPLACPLTSPRIHPDLSSPSHPFAPQIGACRHGDRCSRKHQRPVHASTILLSNVYQNPGMDPGCTMTKQELQDDFDNFYEDMYM